jgi:hypothetical protein
MGTGWQVKIIANRFEWHIFKDEIPIHPYIDIRRIRGQVRDTNLRIVLRKRGVREKHYKKCDEH